MQIMGARKSNRVLRRWFFECLVVESYIYSVCGVCFIEPRIYSGIKSETNKYVYIYILYTSRPYDAVFYVITNMYKCVVSLCYTLIQ